MLTKAAFISSKNTVKTVILENIISNRKNYFLFEYNFKIIYFYDGKAEFSALVLQIHQKSFEYADLVLKKQLLLLLLFLSMLRTVVLLNIFVKMVFFSFLLQKKCYKRNLL